MSPVPFRGPAPPPVRRRPTCANCGNPLTPLLTRHWEPDPADQFKRVLVARSWDTHIAGGYNSYGGLFCTLRCACNFAVLAYRGGYRRRATK